MGRQIHPKGFRLGVSTSWDSQWYGLPRIYRHGKDWDHEIEKIREFIRVSLETETCLVGRIICTLQPLKYNIHVELLSIDVNNDEKLEQLSKNVIKLIKRSNVLRHGTKIDIEYNHVSWENMSATLLGKWIALELEKGTPFRPLKKTIQEWFKDNNQLTGLRVQVKGRLQGAEIANKDWFSLGKSSLQTIVNPIDYSETRAYTLSGVLGIKIWLV